MTDHQTIINSIKTLRHELHKQPGVGFDVETNRNAVKGFVLSYRPNRVSTPGGGLIASFAPTDDLSGGIMLRAELDALPIPDLSNKPYSSNIKGQGHQCGHDGHSAMLCGVLHYVAHLNRAGKLTQPVHFLFQPSEEDGRGAKAMLDDESFDITPDVTLSLHNVPGLPYGHIYLKDGDFTPSVLSLEIELSGAEAHAAQPDTANSPHQAIGEIIEFMKGLHTQSIADQVNSNDFPVAPIFIDMGEPAYGTTAGHAKLGYTIRHCKPDKLKEKQKEIETGLQKIADDNDLALSFKWIEPFEATQNDTSIVDELRETAPSVGLTAHEQDTPFPWGEDYGLFTQKFKGAMFVLGAGEDTPPLHRPEYDFPDQIIPHGIEAFLSYLSKHATNDQDGTDQIIKEILAA